jgi:lysophospholipase L1-like esterase
MKQRLAFLAVVPALAIFSCGRAGEAPPGAKGDRVRVACVGDSITYGLGLWNRERDCYPALLGGMLGGGHEVRNFGVSGAMMREGGAFPYRGTWAFAQATRWNPEIVVIMLGTNDAADWNRRTAAGFVRDCGALLVHFAALPAKPRLFLCLPPPVYAGGEELTVKANPAIREVAAERGVPLIDLDAPLRGRPELFPDGLHPNAGGSKIIAREVYRAVRREEEGTGAVSAPGSHPSPAAGSSST